MSSINTNNGAMVALQTLQSINKNLGATQGQISTGKVVNNAKDNSAVWAISKVMESDVQGFKAVSQSLALGESTVAVARGAAEEVTETLKKMQEEIVSAQDGTIPRAAIQERVDALKAQINSTTSAAQFNGVNLVKGDPGATPADPSNIPGDLTVTSSIDRRVDAAGAVSVTATQITVAGKDLSDTALAGVGTDGTTAVTLKDLDVSTEAGAKDALAAIQGMIKAATDAGASFGSAQSRIESQGEFVTKLSDSLKSGIGSLVDANMEETSARLQALQVQQQLATQSLSIANQAPQSILSLFR